MSHATSSNAPTLTAENRASLSTMSLSTANIAEEAPVAKGALLTGGTREMRVSTPAPSKSHGLCVHATLLPIRTADYEPSAGYRVTANR